MFKAISKYFEYFSIYEVYSILPVLFFSLFLILLSFTVLLDVSKPDERDWRYFNRCALRNHLWIVYLVSLFVCLVVWL